MAFDSKTGDEMNALSQWANYFDGLMSSPSSSTSTYENTQISATYSHRRVISDDEDDDNDNRANIRRYLKSNSLNEEWSYRVKKTKRFKKLK